MYSPFFNSVKCVFTYAIVCVCVSVCVCNCVCECVCVCGKRSAGGSNLLPKAGELGTLEGDR